MFRRITGLLACAGVVALSGCGTSSSASTQSAASVGAKSLPVIKAPAFIPGPLDGMSTPRDLAIRRPLSIIVENYSPDSRPQTGLAQASLVIETLAEVGITRFMAVYLEHDAAKVGPVRSTRMYFDNWASGYHTILAHVGGNDDAQARLWKLPDVFNIDENRWERSLYDTGTPLFWRSKDRLAPHNMYTSTYTLRSYALAQHQNWAYTGAYLAHKAAASLKARGMTSTISIHWADPLAPAPDPAYDVQYKYNRRANTYSRLMGGTPHIDAGTGRPLAPANVVIMRTGNGVADPAAGPTYESITIPVLNSGQALIFRDGHELNATWRQPGEFTPLRFYDRTGREVALDPGQTWIEVVPSSSQVSWTSR